MSKEDKEPIDIKARRAEAKRVAAQQAADAKRRLKAARQAEKERLRAAAKVAREELLARRQKDKKAEDES